MDAKGEMKCIAYISEAPTTKSGVSLPIGLSDIVRSANRNPNTELTGFLCYRQGYYLQLIEGPNQTVNQLIAKISTDPRHANPQVIIDKPISRRSFRSWGMSVLDFSDPSQLFDQFIEGYRSDITEFTEHQKSRIQHFYDFSSILVSGNSNPRQDYSGKNLRLISWPDFTRINHSQMVVDLCVKLTKAPYPFDQLVIDEQLGTREEIVKTIREFDALGILRVIESDVPREQIEEVQNKKPSRFFGAIKKFLGMG